jgi:prevent-host-death family protein
MLRSLVMADIPARELRNDVSAVLRRVERGERLRVTVRGRPVAELVPLPARPTSMTWDAFVRDSHRWRADTALADELAELLPGTTADLPIQ